MKRKSSLSETENDIRMAMYNAGFSDRQIAKERGVSSQSIHYWRKNKNIPPNYKTINMKTGEQISYARK